MRLIAKAACSLLLFCGPAMAGELSIPIAGNAEPERIEASYGCGERRIDVTYINAGSVSLAVFEIDGESVVASNVISGSGARYAGGRYIWWSKGDTADLYDLMEDGEDTPVASCTAAR